MPHYLVALSGGADSVCLLLTLLEKGEVGAAAHCNFQLRGEESERDEQFVRQLCQEKGVRLLVKRFNTTDEAKRTGESIEMAARRLRYDWFRQLLGELQLDAVAVGHHQEDNAETILLNLVRGTGLTGLTGMQPFSQKQGFAIYRPLLSWSKQEILQHLAQCGQPYVTDSTNADTHYRRNRVRHDVLPLLQTINPQVVSAINQMAQHLTEAQSLAAEGLEALKRRCQFQVITQPAKGWSLNWEQLKNEPNAPTLLHHLLHPWHFSATQISDALNMRTGALIETQEALLTRNGRLLIFSTRTASPSAATLPLPQNVNEESLFETEGFTLRLKLLPRADIATLKCPPNVALIDVEKASLPLVLRPTQQADRFQPLGMNGSQLVSDYLTNRHRSRIEKLNQKVVNDQSKRIVWLVNERLAHPFRLTDKTKLVLRITFEPKT